jgi:Flp pilus assembly protein TadD
VFGDLGAMMEHTGQLKKAVRAYSNGLILAPKDVKLLNKRAWAYDQLGKRDLALEDFATAARVDPENGEAHSGLGYVRALQKRVPEAQREAHLALLHGSDKYIVLHNVACIYAALSQAEEGQAVDYQDVAMALLKQAVKLWKRAPTDLNEIELIAGEPTFEPLKGRRDFRDLLRDG